jgi:hypothetical protein
VGEGAVCLFGPTAWSPAKLVAVALASVTTEGVGETAGKALGEPSFGLEPDPLTAWCKTEIENEFGDL